MSIVEKIRVSNIVVTDAEWTPVGVNIDCDYFSIWNVPGGWQGHGSSNVILCTDTDDASTQKLLANGAQEIVAASAPRIRVENGAYVVRRFNAGDVLFYAKAVSGDTVLTLTCLI